MAAPMKRLLLLDDEPSVLSAVTRVLRQVYAPAVLAIESFQFPEEGLLRFADTSFHVVICDYRMPGLNGADVLQMMRQLQPCAVRILLSGTDDVADLARVVNEGHVFRIVRKPWDGRTLLAAVHAAFEHVPVCTQPVSNAQALELARLESEEPGITRVQWTIDGSIRL